MAKSESGTAVGEIKTVRFRITGTTPYSQSRPIQSIRKTGEGHDAFEQRTWRERMHVDGKGQVFIPPMALKNCLAEVAKFLGESVPGKRTSTYTKHFEAGLMVVDPILLGIKADDVAGEKLFVPSDGKRGGGKRVWKWFPVMPAWGGIAEVTLLDPTLTAKPEKVEEYAGHAGKFIGMGRFRPRNNGYYGRFEVSEFEVL